MCYVPSKVLPPPTSALVFYHIFGDFIFQGWGGGGVGDAHLRGH